MICISKYITIDNNFIISIVKLIENKNCCAGTNLYTDKLLKVYVSILPKIFILLNFRILQIEISVITLIKRLAPVAMNSTLKNKFFTQVFGNKQAEFPAFQSSMVLRHLTPKQPRKPKNHLENDYFQYFSSILLVSVPLFAFFRFVKYHHIIYFKAEQQCQFLLQKSTCRPLIVYWGDFSSQDE